MKPIERNISATITGTDRNVDPPSNQSKPKIALIYNINRLTKKHAFNSGYFNTIPTKSIRRFGNNSELINSNRGIKDFIRENDFRLIVMMASITKSMANGPDMAIDDTKEN